MRSMHYFEVAPLAIVRSNQDRFTYSSEEELQIGTLVRIPVGKKQLTGVVFARVKKPAFETKPITSVIETTPVPLRLLRVSEWLRDYYATHLAVVLQTVLPAGLHKNRRERHDLLNYPERERTKIVLNSQQKAALNDILTATPGTILLKGVTGSGKTRVYIETAKRLAADGSSAIVLVPEIALTPQLIAEFRHDFTDDQLIVTHSGMTEAQRHASWLACLHATKPMIVIGPRSALFSPLPKLGLVVIDEAHEPSFKQDQSPRYSAIRTATMLASYESAKVILGSATPSAADYYLAQAAKRPVIELTKSAVSGARTPVVQLVSFQKREEFSEHRIFSKPLLAIMRRELTAGHQVLLFHNRRGTAPLTICSNCGWQAMCPTCFVPLTLHADKHRLFCHLCAFHQPVPFACPQCKNPDIIHKGIGTKLIADELQKMFPKFRLARFDADNSTEETLQANYQALYDGDIQIIIGTQLVAKGLDLPKLRVVGVLQADTGLSMPDYQAEERTFQLLYQVAGRVGRQADTNTEVIIQTYQPNHPVIQFGLQKDFDSFYKYTIDERQKALFPPFTHLLKLVCVYNTEASAVSSARKLAAQLRKTHPRVRLLGPTPAFYERLGGKYRWQLLLKSPTRATLQEIAANLPKPWQADLDPHSLL